MGRSRWLRRSGLRGGLVDASVSGPAKLINCNAEIGHEHTISLRGVPIDSPVALVDTVQIDVWTTAATRVRCSLAPMLKDGVDTSLSKCRDAAVLGEVVWVAFVAVVVVVG